MTHIVFFLNFFHYILNAAIPKFHGDV